jgi:hypothetical protein
VDLWIPKQELQYASIDLQLREVELELVMP